METIISACISAGTALIVCILSFIAGLMEQEKSYGEAVVILIIQIIFSVYSVLLPILVGYIIKLLKDQKREGRKRKGDNAFTPCTAD